MAGIGKDSLQGQWVHSHEEDSDDEIVFRPAAQPLPPSRGRMSLELRADGSYVQRSPGPVDVPEEHGGQWSLDEKRRLVLAADGDQPQQTWKVVAAEGDRLALKRA